jgi:hypothetical protein
LENVELQAFGMPFVSVVRGIRHRCQSFSVAMLLGRSSGHRGEAGLDTGEGLHGDAARRHGTASPWKCRQIMIDQLPLLDVTSNGMAGPSQLALIDEGAKKASSSEEVSGR